jgi:hypothetical protein
MYDAGKVIIGVIVFVALVTFPVWYNGIAGKAEAMPDLVYPDQAVYGTQCVADRDYMRDSHMDLLNEWRDQVVRDGRRVHVTADGRRFVMSLQNTCMGCHAQKAQFCDQCHNYLSVSPYCWTCHVEPGGSL